jgi:hypothetical protein
VVRGWYIEGGFHEESTPHYWREMLSAHHDREVFQCFSSHSSELSSGIQLAKIHLGVPW